MFVLIPGLCFKSNEIISNLQYQNIIHAFIS